ncbi:hypothetical protein L2E82_32678 [Cichorium intybus]|uniref:Uncharacterized protein n=1 Tax=Cichorium intybus TaxID=13427 RepID=A0ACB9BIG2_CICIN|nr:hypothetical protein L2E82_32678 [Cichorium intybus]
MGWFSVFPCFNTSKHRKLKKSVNPTTSSFSVDEGNEKTCESVLIKVPTEESTNLGPLQNSLSESRNNSEDHLINDSDDKPVTIDFDVEADADIFNKEVENLSVETNEDKEKNTEEIGNLGVLVQLENEKEREIEEKKENANLGNPVQIENERELKTEENKNEAQNRACSDSSVSSYISYPPMHRYHNCVINEDDDHVMIQEDSSESLFSLSINPRRHSKSCPVEFDDKEVNSPLKTHSPKLNAKPTGNESLLNPIENLTQWKTLIPKPIPTFNHHKEKENIYLQQQETHIPISEEPTSKVSDQKGKVKKDSVVTTSLSSWLIEPDKTREVSMCDSQISVGNSCSYSDEVTSWKSFEDRPILGAWTIDEVRQVSARSSPRKSPCRDLDETPIIGSVGSYWNHTGQGTDSSNSFSSPLGKPRRNREKKASSCHSTPVKARLERALDKNAV